MKKPLSIQVLESIECAKPSAFPIHVNLGRPLEGVKAQPDEILQEIYRLTGSGLLDSALLPLVEGKPSGGAIKMVTHQGKRELAEWRSKADEESLAGTLSRHTRDVLFFCLGAIAGGFLGKYGEYLFNLTPLSKYAP